MKIDCIHIDYSETGFLSSLIKDYLNANGNARTFVQYEPNYKGIEAAIEQRKKSPINRNNLVEVLSNQYQQLGLKSQAVQDNIALLLDENSFTITTAHQPNIFTGPLYFFYKIIHAIQLAANLKQKYPQYHFIPVYYMGSEDADIEEVGSFVLDGKKHQWNTAQTGAIGRMKVDDALMALLDKYVGYWSVKPAGKEVLSIIQNAYQKGKTIGEATIEMVNALFGQYGLLVVEPDNAKFKQLFIPVVEKELLEQFSHEAIQQTLQSLDKHYHVQTEGRLLNLFYLNGAQRNRIEKQGNDYVVVDTEHTFSESAILEELYQFPEKFSPNVILRGVYQETILPGIAFIGGGGELAYWMELKNVFEKANAFYPVLILRNSYAIVHAKQKQQWDSLGFNLQDIFKTNLELAKQYVTSLKGEQLLLTDVLNQHHKLYTQIEQKVMLIDATLGAHVKNLALQSEKKLMELEKKMLRSERRKQSVAIERIHSIKESLFPNNSLQERSENMAEWIGEYGWDWVDALMMHANTLEANFTILVMDKTDY